MAGKSHRATYEVTDLIKANFVGTFQMVSYTLCTLSLCWKILICIVNMVGRFQLTNQTMSVVLLIYFDVHDKRHEKDSRSRFYMRPSLPS